ncbi:hypothetical protein ACFWM7_01070 [Streptomyces sp. NPDC058375]|uniref:hypothetical protein n=1 Tax=Streptomyces sp. NPDC058375 TaxID=3346467 RepID=UPI003653BF79
MGRLQVSPRSSPAVHDDQLDVTSTTIDVCRLGNPNWTTVPIAYASYRGGYSGLSN